MAAGLVDEDVSEGRIMRGLCCNPHTTTWDFILNATEKESTDGFRQKRGMACTVLPAHLCGFGMTAVSAGSG